MNRRDAIKALTSLPGVATISTAPVRPSDVIVVEVDRSISCETAKRMRDELQLIWPGQKIVILEGGLKLKIVEGSKVE